MQQAFCLRVQVPGCTEDSCSLPSALVRRAAMDVDAASSVTPASKRKSLVGQAFDRDASEVKKARNRADVSIMAQVRKCLYDHCRAWSTYQIEVLLVDGVLPSGLYANWHMCGRVVSRDFRRGLRSRGFPVAMFRKGWKGQVCSSIEPPNAVSDM
eukprot:1188456-Amphidinium_carterae.3